MTFGSSWRSFQAYLRAPKSPSFHSAALGEGGRCASKAKGKFFLRISAGENCEATGSFYPCLAFPRGIFLPLSSSNGISPGGANALSNVSARSILLRLFVQRCIPEINSQRAFSQAYQAVHLVICHTLQWSSVLAASHGRRGAASNRTFA